MTKSLLSLAVMAALAIMATSFVYAEPVYSIAQTKEQAIAKLEDAELNQIQVKPDGLCWKFDAIRSIPPKDHVGGFLCGDVIVFSDEAKNP